MPIEIRELVIKATIQDPMGEARPSDSPCEDREEIIADCVEQVMTLLRDREER